MDNAALLDELMGVNRNHDKADAVITVQSTLLGRHMRSMSF